MNYLKLAVLLLLFVPGIALAFDSETSTTALASDSTFFSSDKQPEQRVNQSLPSQRVIMDEEELQSNTKMHGMFQSNVMYGLGALLLIIVGILAAFSLREKSAKKKHDKK